MLQDLFLKKKEKKMLQDLGSRVDELYTKLSIFGLYTNNQYIIIFNSLMSKSFC